MIAPTSKNRSYAHGHAAVFYSNAQEYLKLLAQYYAEGLAQGELCIFVSSQTPEEVITSFAGAGLYVAEALANGHLQLLEMDDTYLPNGEFAADTMLQNVARFIDDAAARGYKGLRAAGDMLWISQHPEFQPAAAHYEANVTDLGRKHADFVGLCLYPLQDDNVAIVQDALRTHPVYAYDAKFTLNPYLSSSGRNPIELTSREAVETFLMSTV